jgi:hypothetical protein
MEIPEGGYQTGIFAVHKEVLLRAILMLSIYLLLNFQNLPRAISKLSSQGGVNFMGWEFHGRTYVRWEFPGVNVP